MKYRLRDIYFNYGRQLPDGMNVFFFYVLWLALIVCYYLNGTNFRWF